VCRDAARAARSGAERPTPDRRARVCADYSEDDMLRLLHKFVNFWVEKGAENIRTVCRDAARATRSGAERPTPDRRASARRSVCADCTVASRSTCAGCRDTRASALLFVREVVKIEKGEGSPRQGCMGTSFIRNGATP